MSEPKKDQTDMLAQVGQLTGFTTETLPFLRPVYASNEGSF